MSEFKCPGCGAALLVSAKPSQTGLTMQEVKALFPKDLTEKLYLEEGPDYILVKPRQFLGSENFARVMNIVRGSGGEYVSAGKESHFRIPTKKT